MMKEFNTILIVNYKTGKFRVVNKLIRQLNGYDIPINVKLNINIPEKPVVIATGKIDLSQEKVHEMFIEEL